MIESTCFAARESRGSSVFGAISALHRTSRRPPRTRVVAFLVCSLAAYDDCSGLGTLIAAIRSVRVPAASVGMAKEQTDWKRAVGADDKMDCPSSSYQKFPPI